MAAMILRAGQTVEWSKMACIVILVWEGQALLSPILKEDHYVAKIESIVRVIRDRPAPIAEIQK